MSSLYASRWAKTPPPEVEQEHKDEMEVETAAEAEAKKVVQGLDPQHSPESAMNDVPTDQKTEVEDAAEASKDEDVNAEATEEGNIQNIENETPAAQVEKKYEEDANALSTLIDLSNQEPLRPSRRIPWRGKMCMIAIPHIDFDALRLPKPMSTAQISERIKHFEDAGYNTRGFDLQLEDGTEGSSVHVKPIYPDESELEVEANENWPKVSLPDLKKWAAYIDELTEQKLAALGVSTGLDEPAPAPAQDLSRQSSGQYPPLPFSPPIPPTSGGSMVRPGMMRGHSHTMSVASPISPGAGPFGHMHRHSTFTGPFHYNQQGLQHPQQAQALPIPGMQALSPQQHFGMPALPHGSSPAQLASLRPELGPARGPGSPLSQHMFPPSPQEYSRALMEDQRKHQIFSQSIQQPQMSQKFVAPTDSLLQTPVLPELPEENDEEELKEPQSEPAPAPQALEPGTKQPDPPAYVPPDRRAQFNADIAIPTPRGHHHNISEGLERDILESEVRHNAETRNWIEVNEYGDDQAMRNTTRDGPHSTIVPEEDPLGAHYPVQESVRSHKKSASRFNVSAPAFTFNPNASFQPTSAAFTFGDLTPEPNGLPARGHTRPISSGSYNVAALPFKPADGPSVPSSEFSFSTPGLAFKPNAAPFEPQKPRDHTIVDELPSIFGKVHIPDIVKPARRSKAVQIVKPEERKSPLSGADVEDEDGRIVQSDDRLKRQRKTGSDGDEVPLFAEPTPMPDAADFQPKASDEAKQLQRVQGENEGSKADAAQPTDAIAEKSGTTVEARVQDAHAQHELPREDTVREPQVHKKSVSLSALAKPFEPPYPIDDFEVQQKTKHERRASFNDFEYGEIEEEERIAEQAQHDLAEAVPESPAVHEVPPSERIAKVSHPEPSFDEIDAVMRHLNEAKDEPEMKDGGDVSPIPSIDDRPLQGVTYLPQWSRSDGPSPSPTRQKAQYNPLPDSSFTVHDRTDSGEPALNGWPQVNRLNNAEDVPPSDWSDALSPPDQDKLIHRSSFFDSHIDNIVGTVVERRLLPLEDTLRSIEDIVKKGAIVIDHPDPKRSSSNVESDADDEDDHSDAQHHRPISRGRDKRFDQIKAAVLEAVREHSPRRSQPSYNIADLHSALADMKSLLLRAPSASLELEDIRVVVEEALSRHSQAIVPRAIDEGNTSHKRELSELEGRLHETLAGALEEANHRRAIEEREADTRMLLRLAEEELELLRGSSHDEGSKTGALEDERKRLLDRVAKAEDIQHHLEDKVKVLEAENAAMQGTLEEYRMSSTKWRQDIDEGKRDREELENTIAALERQVEEGQEASSSMRRRLEKLYTDMAGAAGQLASDKAAWKAQEGQYRSRCEALETQQAVVAKEKGALESELRDLRACTAEESEAKAAHQHLHSPNASLEDLVRKLQIDLAEQQTLAAQYERDLHDAQEAGRVEVHRVRMSLETEVEAVNHQVRIVRADLETELSKVRLQLDNATMEADIAKARHERMLVEEDISRRETLRKVNGTHSVALDEARHRHETAVHELTTQHNRALQHALEDRERSEFFFNERLGLTEAKLQHSHDRIAHLEERLEVAKSAAHAAALSAQSMSNNPSSGLPEKVSPQALRESILVLQEQLQDREARIDQLQNQVDPEGPAKLRERDMEISWLRELLGVRSEELTDLVNTLSQPAFDRDVVRDTTIRIRANLQMQQQEKERFGYAAQPLGGQALASLSSFATPRAAQLTSAFVKWRSSMESSTLRNAPYGAAPHRSATPSKVPSSAEPPGYMAGLMTPPASNMRNTPSPQATVSLPPPRLHSQSASTLGSTWTPEHYQARSRKVSASSEAPTTPLLREQSYDRDAEDSMVHMQTFEDDDLDVADSNPPAFRSLRSELQPSAPPENPL